MTYEIAKNPHRVVVIGVGGVRQGAMTTNQDAS